MQYALIISLAACLALSFRWRWAASLGVLLAALLFVSGLGTAMPSWLRAPPEGTLIAASMAPKQAIYVWIQTEDGPRAYKLPWSEQEAQELSDAQRKAGKKGRVKVTGGSARGFFSDQEGGERRFEVEMFADPEKAAG